MEANNFELIDYQRPVSRATMLVLLTQALRVKEYRFARQAALAWLSTFPGDLYINHLLAQAMACEGRTAQVLPIITELCDKDPEFIEGWRLLAGSRLGADGPTRARARVTLAALGEPVANRSPLPEWAQLLHQARQLLAENQLEQAEGLVHTALQRDPQSPLPAILHTWITCKQGDMQALRNLASVYHAHWPECIQFALFLAEARLHLGDEGGSVELLHQCVAYDAAGQVADRIWGADFPYRPLWPERMEMLFNVPVPAALSAALGWNQLPEGEQVVSVDETEVISAETSEVAAVATEPAQPKGADSIRLSGAFLPPDTLRAIQDEFERLARRLRKPEVGTADGRFPIYLILSTRSGLEKQVGPQSAMVLDQEMNKLAETIRRRPNWGAAVFYADDPSCAASYGIKPVPASDPWKIKLQLADLDAALAKKGEMIGALLLVGGPEVVPFHRLPNPTDDTDAEILSDNPYTTRDENYFVPEWPVGRLPGGAGTDAGLLLTGLRKITAYHTRSTRPQPWWRRNPFLRKTVRTAKSAFSGSKSAYRMKPSFGYSAAIWKQSSAAVYKSIGEGGSMLISPPNVTGSLLETGLVPAHLTYFNLHGLSDSADWYGQKEPTDQGDGPDYPVALSPADVQNHGQAPRIVFTEACYGAFIENKSIDQSLALKFLSSGTLAVIGSTCISYGSITTPLIAADLLGQIFWKCMREGQTVGDSFRQAKVQLVQEMNRRQGFLDGEDQKTLISFVLYGDPLVNLDEVNTKAKTFIRAKSLPVVKTISDTDSPEMEDAEVPPVLVSQAKKIVQQYLPGYNDADLSFTPLESALQETFAGVPEAKHKKLAGLKGTRVVVSKEIQIARLVHRHFARITLDSRGKMVKLVVSR